MTTSDAGPAGQTTGLEVAIVGMAGRYPGANDVEELWQGLCSGTDALTPLSADELAAAGVPPAVLEDPSYVKVGAVLQDVERFDAAFFGYTAREAELMDPQQRLFLECAWEALEHAGYDAQGFPGPIGVFGGSSFNTYLLFNLAS